MCDPTQSDERHDRWPLSGVDWVALSVWAVLLGSDVTLWVVVMWWIWR